MFLVVALCVLVPILELAVFWQVAQWIGGWEALFLLLAISLMGAWLVKVQGVSVFRQGRTDLAERRVPGRAIVDGGLIVAAGCLLLIPGFVTAILGLALLVPFTRVPVRELLIRRWTKRYTARIRVASGGTATVIAADSVVRPGRTGTSGAQELGRQRAIEAGDEPLG